MGMEPVAFRSGNMSQRNKHRLEFHVFLLNVPQVLFVFNLAGFLISLSLRQALSPPLSRPKVTWGRVESSPPTSPRQLKASPPRVPWVGRREGKPNSLLRVFPGLSLV